MRARRLNCRPFFVRACTDLLPTCDKGLPATREFLLKVVDILLDYVKEVNDRKEKVLNFRHPAEMMALLKLELPDKGVTLQTLIEDCHVTMKNHVKTGKFQLFCTIANPANIARPP